MVVTPPGLPAVLVSTTHLGAHAVPLGAGLLLHDLNLLELVRLSARPGQSLAVDLDSVEGLAADEAAVEFLAARLGVAVLITRRPGLAARAPDYGCLALLHVHLVERERDEPELDVGAAADRVDDGEVAVVCERAAVIEGDGD